MKGLLTYLCMIAMSTSALASTYNTDYYQGNTYQRMSEARERAQKICYNMYSSSSLTCIQVARANQFSLEGVKVCEGVGTYNDVKKLECLTTIANKAFQKELTEVCNATSNTMVAYGDNTKINCLEKVANKRVQAKAIGLCANVGIYYPEKKMECVDSVVEKTFTNDGIELCNTINYSDFNKISCINLAANSYIQPEAANLCKTVGLNIYSEQNKVSCIEKIKNKVFNPQMLNFCATRFSDQQKLDCLAVAQGNTYSIPGFRVDRQRTDLDIVLDTLDYIINGPRQTDTVIVVTPRPQVQVKEKECTVRAQGSNVIMGKIAVSKFTNWLRTEGVEGKACAIGRLGDTDGSSMLVDSQGTIRIKNATYSQIDAYKRSDKANDLRGQGCAKFICDAIN